jgi:hypothetical protein
MIMLADSHSFPVPSMQCTYYCLSHHTADLIPEGGSCRVRHIDGPNSCSGGCTHHTTYVTAWECCLRSRYGVRSTLHGFAVAS